MENLSHSAPFESFDKNLQLDAINGSLRGFLRKALSLEAVLDRGEVVGQKIKHLRSDRVD